MGIDVSVVLVTYNHELFLTQAIEGVLAQQTRAPFELLISEDCSSDRTSEIVRRFAERHPDRIRVFFSNQNLNSNIVTLRALHAARGRYIAFLDGDDYWTSDRKLQNQVDFLDEHTHCAMCFHEVMVVREDGTAAPYKFPTNVATFTELPDLLNGNYIGGCSAMVRSEALKHIPEWYEHAPYGDWPIYVFAAQRGTIGFIPQPLGVYRLHGAGLWSSAGRDRQIKWRIEFYKTIGSYLGPSYHTHISSLLARCYFELGVLSEDDGAYVEAFECLTTSIRLQPFVPTIPRGRRAWRLTRLGLRALLRRGVSPRQAALAVIRSASSAHPGVFR